MGTVSEELYVGWSQAGNVPVSIMSLVGLLEFWNWHGVLDIGGRGYGSLFNSTVDIHSDFEIYPRGMQYNFNTS